MESQSLLVFLGIVVQSEGMVVGTRHRVGPHVVTVFQVLPDLLPSHAKHEQQVLEAVQLKHVGHGHVARLDGRIKREGRRQRDVGMGYLQLQVVYQVGEGRVAEEALASIDGCLESANLLADILFHLLDLRLEVFHHVLVDLLVEHTDDLALDVLLLQPAVLVGQLNLSLCHVSHITRRVDDQHLLARLVGHPFVVNQMVVSEEDDVEAGHLSGHRSRRVLLIVLSDDASVLARVEQAEDQVGALLLLDILHPFLGAAYHLLKLHALPYRLVQPVGDSGRQHADHADLHPVLIVHGVGLYPRIDVLRIGLAVLGALLHDVRTEQRTAYLSDPLVIHLVARLDIVVAHGLCVVAHIVDHAGREVLVVGHHVVRPVHAGLSLHDVAVVDQQQVVAILCAFLLNIGIGAHERSFQRRLLHEVIGEEMAVNVAGLNHFQLNGLGLLRKGRGHSA